MSSKYNGLEDLKDHIYENLNFICDYLDFEEVIGRCTKKDVPYEVDWIENTLDYRALLEFDDLLNEYRQAKQVEIFSKKPGKCMVQ